MTRYKSPEPFQLESQSIESDLTKFSLEYTQYCVTGLNFGFSDGTSKKLGSDGTNKISIDLNQNKKLYSFQSFCDELCHLLIVCIIDTINNTVKCFRSGNTNQNYIDLSSDNYVDLTSINLKSMFGTFKTGCITNLGISYSLLASISNSPLSFVSLRKYYGPPYPSSSKFTQPILLNNGQNKLVTLTVRSDEICVTGFDFKFTDNLIVKVGSNGTKSVDLDLSGNKTFHSISSYCALICDFMRFCSIDNTNIKTKIINCVDAGNLQNDYYTNLFVSTKDFRIQAFSGDNIIYLGSNCIQSIGISYNLK